MSDSFSFLWTIAGQAPLSMGFPRQEYRSGLPFLSPGDLPDPGIEPQSPALQTDSLPSEPLWKPYTHTHTHTHTHHIFIHSSVDEHLGSSHVLPIVNSAAVNAGARVFLNWSFLCHSQFLAQYPLSCQGGPLVVPN